MHPDTVQKGRAMRSKPRLRRLGGTVAISLSLALSAATAAHANSIVYLKSGNVWLSSPDASQQYQLTFDGGWDSPSEADDGTIMAVKGGQTYRFTAAGQLLGAPVPTIFHNANPSTNTGPAGARISPDATKQAYWGQSYTSYEDYSCGCVLFRWEAYMRWGASDQFNEPNQTKGQQLYGEPAWIDNNTLMVSNVGSVFGDEVATYTIGGGDNSLTQWFSDPDSSVKELQFGTVTRQGDKLAFVASTQAAQDQIRFYQSSGPAPSAPTPMCAITGPPGGQFSYTSFAPDGMQIAWQESDGIHVGSVGPLSDCGSITDRLTLPGGTQPFFGAADVNMANAPSAPTSSGTGSAAGPGGSVAGPGGSIAGPGGSVPPASGGTGQPLSAGGQRTAHPNHHGHHHRPRRRHRHVQPVRRARPGATSIRPIA